MLDYRSVPQICPLLSRLLRCCGLLLSKKVKKNTLSPCTKKNKQRILKTVWVGKLRSFSRVFLIFFCCSCWSLLLGVIQSKCSKSKTKMHNLESRKNKKKRQSQKIEHIEHEIEPSSKQEFNYIALLFFYVFFCFFPPDFRSRNGGRVSSRTLEPYGTIGNHRKDSTPPLQNPIKYFTFRGANPICSIITLCFLLV